MNGFGFMDAYIAQAKPHLERIGVIAQEHATYIGGRLTNIDHALTAMLNRDDGYRVFSVILPPAAVLPAVATVDAGQVPAGETWVLEAASNINGNSMFVFSNGVFRARVISGAFMPPLRFVGPCDIAVAQTGGGTDSIAAVQYRIPCRRTPRPTHFAGQRETGIAEFDGQRDHSPLHSGIGG